MRGRCPRPARAHGWAWRPDQRCRGTTLNRDTASLFSPPETIGPYRVLHQVGAGVLGPVFRALDPDQEHMVGIKLFRLDVTPEQALVLAEHLGRIAQGLPEHEGLVRPLAAGLEGNAAYLVTEYVGADSIDHRLRRRVPTPLDQVLPLVEQMAAALDAASAAGFYHGALHPRDVLVSTRGTACLTGVGVAQALEAAGWRPPFRRPYAAPERLAGRPWDGRADVFTLAVLAVELTTGRRPLMPENAASLQWIGLDDDARTAAVRLALARALEEDPGARDATASGWAGRLSAAFRGELFDESGSDRAAVSVPVASVGPAAAVSDLPRATAEASDDLPLRRVSNAFPSTESAPADFAFREQEEEQEEEGDLLAGGEPPDALPGPTPFGGETVTIEPAPEDGLDQFPATTPGVPDAGPIEWPPADDRPTSGEGRHEFDATPVDVESPPPEVAGAAEVDHPATPPIARSIETFEDATGGRSEHVGVTDERIEARADALARHQTSAWGVSPPPPAPPTPAPSQVDTRPEREAQEPASPGTGLRMPRPLQDIEPPPVFEPEAPAGGRFSRGVLAALAACLLIGFLVGYFTGRRGGEVVEPPGSASAGTDIPLPAAAGNTQPGAAGPTAGPPREAPAPPRTSAPAAREAGRETQRRATAPRSSTTATREAPRAATRGGGRAASPGAAALAVRDGRILVRSTPANAEVRVNGAVRGRTPLPLRSLEYGTYRIAVSAPGYAIAEREVTISRANPAASLTIDLVRERQP